MNIESVREYCLSLPLAEEYFPFDETTLAFRVLGRIFAMIDLEDTKWFVLKCEPEFALQLREEHAEVAPAWHMNKRHWNQIDLMGHLSNDMVRMLIRHSYVQVVKKLPRSVRDNHPAVMVVQE